MHILAHTELHTTIPIFFNIRKSRNGYQLPDGNQLSFFFMYAVTVGQNNYLSGKTIRDLDYVDKILMCFLLMTFFLSEARIIYYRVI